MNWRRTQQNGEVVYVSDEAPDVRIVHGEEMVDDRRHRYNEDMPQRTAWFWKVLDENDDAHDLCRTLAEAKKSAEEKCVKVS